MTGTVSIELVERDHGRPLERASIVASVDGEPVLLRASRWRSGRWSLLSLDGRFESGEPFADQRLNDELLRQAARALHIRMPTYREVDELSGRVFMLERGGGVTELSP